MRKNYGYDSYRGRSGFRTLLKVLAILLAAALILCVLALVFLERYVVVSSDGVKLVLPWMEPEPDPVESVEVLPVQPSEELVLVTPEVVQPRAIHAAPLPRGALYDGTAADQLEAAGANAAIFDMKAPDGSLGYVSDMALAVSAKTSASDGTLNAAIRALNAQEGMYTVARVSCFRDDKLSDADKSLNILTNSGYRWTDPDGLHWSSPTNPAVRDYVTGVCVELAKLGFDEILLDNAGYPTQGNLGYIKKGPAYNASEFEPVISAFYAQVKGALADYPDVKLSIVTTEEALSGADDKSGQTPAALAGSADRIWAPAPTEEGTDYAAILKKAGMDHAGECWVQLAPTPGGADGNWAVWEP